MMCCFSSLPAVTPPTGAIKKLLTADPAYPFIIIMNSCLSVLQWQLSRIPAHGPGRDMCPDTLFQLQTICPIPPAVYWLWVCRYGIEGMIECKQNIHRLLSCRVLHPETLFIWTAPYPQPGAGSRKILVLPLSQTVCGSIMSVLFISWFLYCCCQQHV